MNLAQNPQINMILISCTSQLMGSRHELRITDGIKTTKDLFVIIRDIWSLDRNDVYLLHNGRKVPENAVFTDGIVQAVPRLFGGKGGFGSMLRAIGAQIEKTTNREACRDLSGRRLRDINEEKRLKNWIAQQAEREREAAERKRKKLERLRAEPKHKFEDETYEEGRSLLTEKVSDAVEQGFKLASSGNVGNGQKRKASSTVTSSTKKKKALWLDPDEDELSSSIDSDDSDGDDFQPKLAKKEEKHVSNNTKVHSCQPSGSQDVTSISGCSKNDEERPVNFFQRNNLSSGTDDVASTSKSSVL